jgi:hypothetical protein
MAKRTGPRPSGARRGDARHIPDTGELIWLTFTLQAGREQAGRRPGLVLSPRSYNAKVGLYLVCPVTQHAKGPPAPSSLNAKVATPGTPRCRSTRLKENCSDGKTQGVQSRRFDPSSRLRRIARRGRHLAGNSPPYGGARREWRHDGHLLGGRSADRGGGAEGSAPCGVRCLAHRAALP